MNNWTKLSASLGNIDFAQAGSKLTKGISSSVQATKERLGQVAPEEITELPQGLSSFGRGSRPHLLRSVEYKDLEARVDALRAAHLSLLK
jgi:hypothetical protein